jgi:hypothetical protein
MRLKIFLHKESKILNFLSNKYRVLEIQKQFTYVLSFI